MILMTKKERQDLIEFIKINDITYDYSAVNFNYYSDNELSALKNRIESEMRKNLNQRDIDGTRPSK